MRIRVNHQPSGGKEWIARIAGKHPQYKFEREFLSPVDREWSSTGKTGWTYYEVEEGKIYEVNEPWHGRYFIKIENGEMKEMHTEEVLKAIEKKEEIKKETEKQENTKEEKEEEEEQKKNKRKARFETLIKEVAGNAKKIKLRQPGVNGNTEIHIFDIPNRITEIFIENSRTGTTEKLWTINWDDTSDTYYLEWTRMLQIAK